MVDFNYLIDILIYVHLSVFILLLNRGIIYIDRDKTLQYISK